MSHKLTAADAIAHIPQLVLSHHVHEKIHGAGVVGRINTRLAVVEPDERSAAAGVTGVARTTGAAISPSITGALMSHPLLLNVPFYIAGSLKIVYDVLLYRSFRTLKPPEEKAGVRKVNASVSK